MRHGIYLAQRFFLVSLSEHRLMPRTYKYNGVIEVFISDHIYYYKVSLYYYNGCVFGLTFQSYIYSAYYIARNLTKVESRLEISNNRGDENFC